MRRCCTALSIAVACLMWALGAPGLHHAASPAARAKAPIISSVPNAVVEFAAVVRPAPMRAAPPVAPFAALLATVPFVVAGGGCIAPRRRRRSDVLSRRGLRTRGPPLALVLS